MSKRTRGAQPGNTNALKHGFYSPSFSPTELRDLATLLDENHGLADEIALMRVQIRRLEEAASGQSNFDDLVTTVNALGAATTRLAGLLRTDQALIHRKDDITSILAQAIEEVFGHGLDPRIP